VNATLGHHLTYKIKGKTRSVYVRRVTQRSGTPIFLRDLGRIKLSNQERHGIVGKNENNDVVEGTVLLLKGENPSRVLEGFMPKLPNSTSGWPRTTSVSCPITTARTSSINDQQGFSHNFPGNCPCFICPHSFLGQSTQCPDRRHHDSVRHDDGFHPDEPA